MAQKLTTALLTKYHELKTKLKETEAEFDKVNTEVKEITPVGEFTSPDGKWEVKRWEQNNALKTKEFLEAFSSAEEENASLFENVPNIQKLLKDFPPETHPQYWSLQPNPAAIKEVLGDDADEFFTKSQYVKVVPKK